MPPEAYSEVTVSMARATSANWANDVAATTASLAVMRVSTPARTASVAYAAPSVAAASTVSANAQAKHHHVLLTDHTLTHSAATLCHRARGRARGDRLFSAVRAAGGHAAAPYSTLPEVSSW
ncbi:hypothetical protein GCM10020001_088820 [Nonomuraea salmonea]